MNLRPTIDTAARNPYEQVLIALQRETPRILALVPTCPACSSPAASEQIANLAAHSGYRILLVDAAGGDAWSQNIWWPEGDPRLVAKKDSVMIDAVVLDPERRNGFINVEWLKKGFSTYQQGYDFVIMALPDMVKGPYDPAALAAACESVIVLTTSGQRQTQVTTAIDRIRTAGASISGMIVDQRRYETPGKEIARKLRRHFPALAKRAAESDLLN